MSKESVFYLVGKFRLHMRKKDLAGSSVTAVIIPAVQLALNPDKFPETCTAFSAQGAFKFRHYQETVWDGGSIKIFNFFGSGEILT